MGTWGTAIFSDDTAADVRDDWREAVLDGLDPDAATKKLENDYAHALGDDDESGVFWLALAAAQSETGRLTDRAREQALAVIDSGRDLRRWEDATVSDRRARALVLERLGERLRGPQPPPKRLRRPPRIPKPGPFDVGDLVLVENADNGACMAVVIVAGDADIPVAQPVAWSGTRADLPPLEELAALPFLTSDIAPDEEGNPSVGHSPRPIMLVFENVWEEQRSEHRYDVLLKATGRNASADHRERWNNKECLRLETAWWTLAEFGISGPVLNRALGGSTHRDDQAS